MALVSGIGRLPENPSVLVVDLPKNEEAGPPYATVDAVTSKDDKQPHLESGCYDDRVFGERGNKKFPHT